MARDLMGADDGWHLSENIAAADYAAAADLFAEHGAEAVVIARERVTDAVAAGSEIAEVQPLMNVFAILMQQLSSERQPRN